MNGAAQGFRGSIALTASGTSGNTDTGEVPRSATDAFLGFGPGYRVSNTPEQAWRVQAGIGVRYTFDLAGVSETEEAVIASSRYYLSVTDTMSLTNDTDGLSSSANTVVTNDLGLNFKVSDSLSTRVSFRTDYNSDPARMLWSPHMAPFLSIISNDFQPYPRSLGCGASCLLST